MLFTGYLFAKSFPNCPLDDYYLLEKTEKKKEEIIFVSKGVKVLVKENNSYYNVEVSYVNNNIVYGVIKEIINSRFCGCIIGTKVAFSYGDIIEVLS